MEQRYYRFKHVISGRYLRLGIGDDLSLGSELDDSTLFQFCPLQQEQRKDSNSYLTDESFFKLRHISKKWLRLPVNLYQGLDQDIVF